MKFSDVIQSADWKTEKHVPAIEAPATVKAGEVFNVTVSVGKEVAHPNTTEHHIRWIRLAYKPAEAKHKQIMQMYRQEHYNPARNAHKANYSGVCSCPSVLQAK